MRDDWESRCPLSCKVADCQTACPSRTQDKDTPSNELTRMVKMLMRLHGNRISISLPAVPASELGQSIPRSGSLAREIESHSLCLDGFFHRDRTTLHTTPQKQFREVYYKWHPLYGKSVVVHGHLLKRGRELCR